MTSEEIRATLKPMADFAPAVLKAAEIVAAAEQGEKELATIAQRKKEAEAEIATLFDQSVNLTAKTGQARAEHNKLVQELKAEEESARAATAKARQGLKKVEKEIADALSAKDKTIADKNVEIQKADETLAGIRAEIDRLKKQFAA